MPLSRLRRLWHAVREETPPSVVAPGHCTDAEVAALLAALGVAMVEVVQPTQLVTERLHAVAARYTTSRVRIATLPTLLVIQVGADHNQMEITTRSTTQLDHAGRVDTIARLAAAGAIRPADAITELTHIRHLPHRFNAFVTVLGYAITTLGFGMIIDPTWASLWWHAALGLVVGTILAAGAAFPSLSAIVPTLAATTVTVLASWFIADAANDDLMRVIGPSLVALLPGLWLTVGAMELAGGSIIAGASRLMYGGVQLLLLVFGVTIGIAIAGMPPPQQKSAQLGPWSFYAAVLVIAIGLYFSLSAPRGSLLWLTAAIGIALIAQRVGADYLGASHSGAIGAALVVPFALLAAQIRTAPPMMVMVLAAFWSLAPGVLGFESLSERVTGGPADSAAVVATVAGIFAIALGTLVSWSVLNAIGSRRERVAEDSEDGDGLG